MTLYTTESFSLNSMKGNWPATRGVNSHQANWFTLFAIIVLGYIAFRVWYNLRKDRKKRWKRNR